MATKQQGQHMIALEILFLSLSLSLSLSKKKEKKDWLHQIVIHMFSKEISHISL
jgi:hypothetical protein